MAVVPQTPPLELRLPPKCFTLSDASIGALSSLFLGMWEPGQALLSPCQRVFREST